MALLYGVPVLDFLERLHCRAARIIFNLLKDMASRGVLERAEWFIVRFYYKLAIFKTCSTIIMPKCVT